MYINKSKYEPKDLGLGVECPFCRRRMINNIDLKYNYDYGICSNCFIIYFEGQEKMLTEKLEEFRKEYEDKLVARDAFKGWIFDTIAEKRMEIKRNETQKNS